MSTGSLTGRATKDVGGRCARRDLIAFRAIFSAESQLRRRGQAQRHRTAEVQVRGQHVIFHRACIEGGRRCRTHRGIDRIFDAVLNLVLAIAEACINRKARQVALHAAASRHIIDVRRDQGQEAIWEDRGHVVGVGGQTRIGGAVTDAVLVAEPAIGFEAFSQRHTRIGIEGLALNAWVAVTGRDLEGNGARVEVRTVGRITEAIVSRNGQKTFSAKRQTLPARHSVDIAVMGLATVRITGRLDFGVVLTPAGRQTAAVAGFAQTQVDHTGDGVRAILSRGAVTQHFNAVDRHSRNGVQVDRCRTAADRAVDIDQSRRVVTLTVEQDQGLVRRKAAKGRWTNAVGTIGDGWTREIHRRNEVSQGLTQLWGRLLGQGSAADHVHGRKGFKLGALGDARTGDDQFVNAGRSGLSVSRGAHGAKDQGGSRKARNKECLIVHWRIPDVTRRGPTSRRSSSYSSDVPRGLSRLTGHLGLITVAFNY